MLTIVVLMVVGAVLLVGAEIAGVVRRGRGDTVSEGVWWFRARIPGPVFAVLLTGLAAFFGWVIYHFGWQG